MATVIPNGHTSAYERAMALAQAGFCVVPIRPDGSKAPTVPWERLQSEMPVADELGEWFDGTPNGIAIIGGAISGGLAVLDIEFMDFYADFCALVEAEDPDLITSLPQIKTPGRTAEGGMHLYFRSCLTIGNDKLAQITPEEAERRTGDTGKTTAIETKSEGGYVLTVGCSTRCHESGRLYQHVGGPFIEETPLITDEQTRLLLSAAQVLNQATSDAAVDREPPEDRGQPIPDGVILPGQDFERRGTWDFLLSHGWTKTLSRGGVDYLKRPGKQEKGWSATVGKCKCKSTGDGLLYVFSTNASPFQPGPYGKFRAYALLNHNGSLVLAAKDLYAQGYGTRVRDSDMAAAISAPATTVTTNLTPLPPLRTLLAPIERFSIKQLFQDHPRLYAPVLDGIVRERETCNIISVSKIGKSWLLYALMLSIITGRAWFGRFRTAKGRVLLIDNELHRATLANRIRTVAQEMQIEEKDYVDALDVWPLRGNLRDIHQIAPDIATIKPGDYKGLFFDAKYRMLPAGTSENDNGAETQFYNRLDQYADQTAAAIFNVHHSSKGSQGDKRVTDVGAGAGAQSRAADAHLILREHEQDETVVMEAAVRSFAPIEPLPLRWQFPLWVPADDVDPAKLRGRLNANERKQKENDEDGIQAIVDALNKEQPQTESQLRGSAGLGASRLARLLGVALQRDKISFSNAIKRGNPTKEYRVRPPKLTTSSTTSSPRPDDVADDVP